MFMLDHEFCSIGKLAVFPAVVTRDGNDVGTYGNEVAAVAVGELLCSQVKGPLPSPVSLRSCNR